MSARKAKRRAVKAARQSQKSTTTQLGLDKPEVVEKLHRAHEGLDRGLAIVDCVIHSLEGQEIAYAEQQALTAAAKFMWPASEWMHDRRMDLPPELDGNDGEP